jgi:flagellar hook-associated protein 3 FlgL
MSRVSENSSVHAVNYAVGRTKGKVEDLQMKGSTLKRITKPSDDPIGNVELLALRSQNVDSVQYMRNLNFAQTQLSLAETVVEEITDILVKAKELAVGQASSIYSADVREGVAKEIHQLRQQALGLANKRVGNRYLFAGQSILTRPFDQDGKFQGDNNKIHIEVNKDVFIPINITGGELFFSKSKGPIDRAQLELKMGYDEAPQTLNREPAASAPSEEVRSSVFDELRALENALLTNNPVIVQSLLERLDDSIDRSVAFRTQLGALANSVSNAEGNIEKTKLLNEAHKSKIEDADVTEVFSNLQKEQNILKATYRASSNLMNTSLMDFIK